MKRFTTPQYEVDPGGSGSCAMNGRETPSTTGKKNGLQERVSWDQRSEFPADQGHVALDVEYGMLVQAYFLPIRRGVSDELTDKASYPT